MPSLTLPAPMQATSRPSSLVLPITAAYKETARTLGNLRTLQHNGNRLPCQDLGADRNIQIDYVGLLGELIVLYGIAYAGLQPTEYDLLSNPTPIGPDFRLGRRTFNIKTVPHTGKRQYLAINEAQRTDPKRRADYYLGVVLNDNDDTARILAPIACDALDKWPLRHGHSPYRSCAADTLPTLRDWHSLLR